MLQRLQIAAAALAKGDTRRATSETSAVLADNPSSALAYEIIGSAAMIERDWRQAERALTEAVELNPRNPLALTKLGRTAEAMNDAPRAAELFRKALAITPAAGEARRHLALLAVRQGRIDDAIAELQAGIAATAGSDAKTKFFLAGLYQQLRRPADADRLVTEILTTEPASQPALLLQGIVKLERNDTAGAQSMRKLFRQVPASSWTALVSGAAYRSAGSLKQSLALLEQVTREKQDWALAHFELGETLSALGDLERAREAYGKAKRISADGGHLSVMAGLAELYAWQAVRAQRSAAPRAGLDSAQNRAKQR